MKKQCILNQNGLTYLMPVIQCILYLIVCETDFLRRIDNIRPYNGGHTYYIKVIKSIVYIKQKEIQMSCYSFDR